MADSGPSRAALGQWLVGLARDPEVFLHQLDTINRRVLLVRLDAERIRTSAFLDDRVLEADAAGAWVPLTAAVGAAPHTAGPRGIILHCGHAGSTLVTRLLDELPGNRVLREPLALQPLATELRHRAIPAARLRPDEFDAALALTQAVYAKAPANTSTTLVKHTSFTANLGHELLHRNPDAAVFALWIPLETYLATMLRERELREGLRLLAGEWIWDLAAELGADCPRLADLGDAELAALNWTAAQLAFARANATAGARFLARRFEDFLAAPLERLAELAQFFALAADAAAIERAADSAWLGRYAKDPRYPFDREARAKELAEARRRFRIEIGNGLAFGRSLWSQLPLEAAPADGPDG